MATNRDVKYLNRDFSNFRSKLIEFAKTYFPNSYNDFTPASPGMMFIEMSAYVGDVMAFYLDNQLQETFTQFARQDNNLYELAYMFGYKPKVTGVAQTTLDLYQQLPAKLVGGSYVPDYDYSLTIGENTTITSPVTRTTSFLIQDKCDFSKSSSLDPTEISVYQAAGSIPQFFLLKKQRNAISATINSQTFTFGQFQQFPTIEIEAKNLAGILDIKDSDGNTWYEVDYLAQETVYDSIKNTNINDPNSTENDTPYLLKLKKVQRRFATRLTSPTTLQIQFGAGNPNNIDEEIVPNPNNVGIGLPFEKDKLTTAYSPTNFLFTNTYGIAPTNTTLTVRYLTGGGVEANVSSDSISRIEDTSTIKFNNNNLTPSTANYIFNSVAANNPVAAEGGEDGDTTEEIRQNTLSAIAAQQRSVTLDDYLVRALSMPPRYGMVSKVYIEKPKLTDDQVSTIETLNLFVLTKDSNGNLTQATDVLKRNLRTYLSQYRMIGDNIEIRDAFVINIGIDFEIIVLPNYNNNEVILNCIKSLQDFFKIDKWQLNQPILLRDLYVRLDRVEGVQTVKNVKITNKAGVSKGYSQYSYDIDGATQNQVIYPSLDPSIFEVKFPNQDITGRVSPL